MNPFFNLLNFLHKIKGKITYRHWRYNLRYLGYCGANVEFKNPVPTCAAKIYLYDNVHIYDKATFILSGNGKFIMKKNSGAAQGLTVITGTHGFKLGEWSMKYVQSRELDVEKDILVEEDVRIGANVTLLSGVTLGRGSIIGAGSVISRSIPPYAIVQGNPAEIVSYKFRPKEIIEHERQLYSKEDRLSYDLLYSNYEKFINRKGNSPTINTPPQKNTLTSQNNIDDYRNIFASCFHCSINDVNTLQYKGCEEWDSVGHLILIDNLEKTFNITINPTDFQEIDSYQHGIEILKKYGIDFNKKETINNVTFPNILFDFSSYTKNIALTDGTREISYQEIDNYAKKFSVALHQKSLAIILTNNTFGSIICYIACIKNNIPVILLDSQKEDEIIKTFCQKYQPQYLILPQANTNKYEGKLLFCIEDYKIIELSSMPYPINKDLSLLLTTSGSTGSPKLVRLTQKNIQSNAISIATYLKLTSQERPITSLPMNYSYGLSVINSHLLVGATIIVTQSSVVESNFWRLVKELKATSISGVPYTYELLKKMKIVEMDLPSLKTFTQAGGKMPVENILYFANHLKAQNKQLIVMYGQTEATARMSYTPWEYAISKAGSIGKVIPNGTLSIEIDGRTITEANKVGELVYKGNNVSMGYALSHMDLSKDDENNGVLHTGDLAQFDNDGFFYIVGRMKRFVKIFGNRVGLDELEQLLFTQFGQVVCIGNDKHIIIITENTSVDENQILKYVTKKTHLNQNVFSVKKIQKIPRSESGKISVKKLELQYLMNELRKGITKYDCYITGSDQVFNYTMSSILDIYFLNFTNKRKISYAASFGVTYIPNSLKKTYKHYINNLDAISIREIQGVKIAQELTSNPISLVVDPTFLLDKEKWNKIFDPLYSKPNRYIFVYDLIDSDYLTKYALFLSKTLNAEIVSAAGKTPQQFVYLIANALHVVTTSFHGTALSINFGTNFTTIYRRSKKSNSRMIDLCTRYGMKEHLLYEGESFKNIPTINKSQYIQLLDCDIQKSIVFLQKNLS